MDEARTWHGGRPQPRRLCARWGPTPPQKGAEPPPQFSAHFYCDQTAGCVKMPLGMDVGLSPGDFVLDGEPVPSPRQMAGWVKMPLGMEVGLSRPRPTRHCVRYGPSYPQKKGHTHSHPIFGLCLLWPNGWIDDDAAWYGSRPRLRPHCTRRGPSTPPLFGPYLLWPRSPISATAELL